VKYFAAKYFAIVVLKGGQKVAELNLKDLARIIEAAKIGNLKATKGY
jgi:hypothetical protein